MSPIDLLTLEIAFEPGRPATARLHLRCGLVLTGIRVWRTSRGPRVVFPCLPGAAAIPVLRLSRDRRREWTLAILEAWRVAIAPGVAALPSRVAA